MQTDGYMVMISEQKDIYIYIYVCVCVSIL